MPNVVCVLYLYTVVGFEFNNIFKTPRLTNSIKRLFPGNTFKYKVSVSVISMFVIFLVSLNSDTDSRGLFTL